jgi:hypothetical protein
MRVRRAIANTPGGRRYDKAATLDCPMIIWEHDGVETGAPPESPSIRARWNPDMKWVEQLPQQNRLHVNVMTGDVHAHEVRGKDCHWHIELMVENRRLMTDDEMFRQLVQLFAMYITDGAWQWNRRDMTRLYRILVKENEKQKEQK